MNKFKYFFALAFYTVGAIGGFGNALYAREYFTAVCVLVVAAMAFPKAKEFYHKLVD